MAAFGVRSASLAFIRTEEIASKHSLQQRCLPRSDRKANRASAVGTWPSTARGAPRSCRIRRTARFPRRPSRCLQWLHSVFVGFAVVRSPDSKLLHTGGSVNPLETAGFLTA